MIVIDNNYADGKEIPNPVAVEQEPPPVPHEVSFTPDSKLDRNAERLLRMTHVFSKFAGTLSLRPIKVHVSRDNPDSPAWSDSDSITLQHSHVGDLTKPADVLALKGLNLHEVSHIMLTPRFGSKLAKDIQKAKLWQSFNALEDQRIEMMMTAKFSSVSGWLIATISKHLLSNLSQEKVSFPIIYGRKYLPAEIRKTVRDSYERQQDVAELSSLIDRYIVLNLADTKNYTTAYSIVERYHELVNNLEGTNPNYPEWGKGWARIKDPNGHHSRKGGEWKAGGNKTLTKSQQDSMASKVSCDNGKEYSSGTGMADGNVGGSGIGHGGSLEQTLLDAIDNAVVDNHHDIVQTIKQISGETELHGHAMKPLNRPDWIVDRQPSTQAMLSSKSFASELAELKAKYDPAWVREQSQGKLNVQRYAAGCDVEEAFDEWDSGREDAVDIEAVVLLDISGSMSWTLDSAYESMWAIKRALDKTNASTTVLTFGSKCSLLYSADERATPNIKYAGSEGSTEPLKAIRYARSVLANSNRAIKIVITITDGEWYSGQESDEILKYLRQAGVLTALAYVSDPRDRRDGGRTVINTHGCAIAVNVTNGKDLFTLARQMVKVGVASNLAR